VSLFDSIYDQPLGRVGEQQLIHDLDLVVGQSDALNKQQIWLLDNLNGPTNQWQEADGKTPLFHFPALLSSNGLIEIGKQNTSQTWKTGVVRQKKRTSA